jgi:hypothetical protein
VETTIGAVLYRPFRLVLNRLQGQVVRPADHDCSCKASISLLTSCASCVVSCRVCCIMCVCRVWPRPCVCRACRSCRIICGQPLPGGGYRYTGLFQGLHVAWKQEGWGLFTRNLPLEVLSNVIYNFSQDAIFSSGYVAYCACTVSCGVWCVMSCVPCAECDDGCVLPSFRIASRLHRFLPSSEHELVQYVRSWALEVVENIVCMNASYLLTWPLHVVACRMDTKGIPFPIDIYFYRYIYHVLIACWLLVSDCYI